MEMQPTGVEIAGRHRRLQRWKAAGAARFEGEVVTIRADAHPADRRHRRRVAPVHPRHRRQRDDRCARSVYATIIGGRPRRAARAADLDGERADHRIGHARANDDGRGRRRSTNAAVMTIGDSDPRLDPGRGQVTPSTGCWAATTCASSWSPSTTRAGRMRLQRYDDAPGGRRVQAHRHRAGRRRGAHRFAVGVVYSGHGRAAEAAQRRRRADRHRRSSAGRARLPGGRCAAHGDGRHHAPVRWEPPPRRGWRTPPIDVLVDDLIPPPSSPATLTAVTRDLVLSAWEPGDSARCAARRHGLGRGQLIALATVGVGAVDARHRRGARRSRWRVRNASCSSAPPASTGAGRATPARRVGGDRRPRLPGVDRGRAPATATCRRPCHGGRDVTRRSPRRSGPAATPFQPGRRLPDGDHANRDAGAADRAGNRRHAGEPGVFAVHPRRGRGRDRSDRGGTRGRHTASDLGPTRNGRPTTWRHHAPRARSCGECWRRAGSHRGESSLKTRVNDTEP